MTNQKGFTHWVIIILISVMAAGLVGAAWWYEKNKNEAKTVNRATTTATANTNVNATTNTNITNTNTAALTLTQIMIENTTSLSLKNCVDNLAMDDIAKYNFLKPLYSGFHPELSVIDAGSYCEFSNGMKIVSFAYQTKGELIAEEQSIAVFDADNGYINETTNFYCPTLGDLLAPHFKSLENGILTIYCWSGDAAVSRYEEFEIDLSDFSFEKTISEEGENIELETYHSTANQPETSITETESITNTKTFTYSVNQPPHLTTPNEYSIATAAQVRKPTGITLSDIQVELYDSDLLDTQHGSGRVSDIKCNSDYCLMTIRSAGWQHRILKFQNGNFTDISTSFPGFNAGSMSLISFTWNGNYWMINLEDNLFSYDGTTAIQIDLEKSEWQKVFSVGWNGSYWLVAVGRRCCTSNNTELLHVNTAGTVTERRSILTSLSYPKVHSIYWGNNSWLIAASEQDDKGNKQSPILLTYSGSDDPNDISSLLPQSTTLRFENLFWDGSKWLMHFIELFAEQSTPLLYSYDGTNITSQSSTLIGFETTGISTIHGRPNFYAIAGYISPVANVIQNGSARDLSGYFAMGVYSATTYGDRVIIGGESELEVLTFAYESERTYTSEQINTEGETVTAVKLSPSHNIPNGTAITYEVTNNNGSTWHAINSDETFEFSSSGTTLLWQATLTTDNSATTPSISDISIQYTTT